MKNRFRLYRRPTGGMFYVHDSETGKQASLGTKDRAEAQRLFNARNESFRQPHLNLQIAKAYLAGTDTGVATRTWRQALDAIVDTKSGPTRERWQRAAKDPALESLSGRVIIETQAEHLLASLKAGTVSTNVHLRKAHNFCLAMNWLPWPIIPKRLWPEIRFQPKRAIKLEEHRAVTEREKNPERLNFYELCWHLGGSQSDIANLKAEDIDWANRTIAYTRLKTGSLAMIHFGEDIETILRRLPENGPLFPYLITVRCGDRATEFKQRCKGLGIEGVTLHSYRYAWAERAKQCGYPERFAQEALGHNSKAVHRAYARRAQVRLPSLESYEKQAADGRIIPLPSVAPVLPQLPEGRGQKIG
jgi:integrase